MARVTRGFSGAELANVVNEAALMAVRQEQQVVRMDDMLEGVYRTKFGVNGGARGNGFKSITNWLLPKQWPKSEGSGSGSSRSSYRFLA